MVKLPFYNYYSKFPVVRMSRNVTVLLTFSKAVDLMFFVFLCGFLLHCLFTLYQPHHEKTCSCHMHPHSLISAFFDRCLDSTIPLLAIAEVSRLELVSVAEHTSLCLNWSQTPRTGFLVMWLISCWIPCLYTFYQFHLTW